ncbi:MAG TPA: 50S ribosomal protein L17 [Anaerolineaceae bacterium]|jgi:large subunit ribosomal protein L17|nr:50S ribosomal protein L17 [Anaerolineaceae bacterium]HOC22709.1 50S ribosomal protein L17 [Anaerolineaceae bacterium]HOF24799.1 50S ribosomal protein L17 [Anaerolineaceae bacterium]HOO57663.1 50S ribosomal protein L17 [Anaerolineaceae bacterium]HOR77728.1 50S ribosomal protein L17 [Anaerolineaceae bacterium]
MRHQVKGYHLGRSTGQRNALRRTMIMQLFQYEKIETTLAKAKAIQPEAEKLITMAKNSLDGSEIDQINARRRAAADLGNASGDIVKKLFDDIAPRFKNRQGGYTRILKLGPRQGDSAEMVLIELVAE